MLFTIETSVRSAEAKMFLNLLREIPIEIDICESIFVEWESLKNIHVKLVAIFVLKNISMLFVLINVDFYITLISKIRVGYG